MKGFIVIIFILSSLTVFGEGDKPKDVDLLIPPVIVEIEHSDREDITIDIPDFNDIMLPSLGIDLPDPVDIAVKEIPVEIPFPLLDVPEKQINPPFFSEGSLGFGMDNQLKGNIQLFKLGAKSGFSLSFSHDSLDGYGLRKAGEGFFSRTDSFEGTFHGENKGFSYKGDGYLKETAKGFQGLITSYSSVIHQFRSFSFSSDLKREKWDYNGSFLVQNSERVLSGVNPSFETLLGGIGKAGISLSLNDFMLSLDGSYQMEYRSAGENVKQLAGLTLSPSYQFPSLEIGASGGIGYIPEIGVVYPFSLSLSGILAERVRFKLDGGYSTQIFNNYSLWETYPFSEGAEGINQDWYFNGKVQSDLPYGISVSAGWDYRDILAGVAVSDSSLPLSPEGLFIYKEQSNKQFLTLSGSVSREFGDSFSVLAEFKGQVLGRANPFDHLWEIDTRLNYKAPGNSFNGSVYGNWFSDQGPFIPDIGGVLSFGIGGGGAISVKVTDILPLLLGKDRILAGPYVDVSGMVTVELKISI